KRMLYSYLIKRLPLFDLCHPVIFHPFIRKNITVIDYLQKEEEWVRGTHDDVDLSTVMKSVIRRSPFDESETPEYELIEETKDKIELESEKDLLEVFREDILSLPVSMQNEVAAHIGSMKKIWPRNRGIPIEVDFQNDMIISRRSAGEHKKMKESYPELYDNFIRQVLVHSRMKNKDVNIAESIERVKSGNYDDIKLIVFDYDGTLAEEIWPEGIPLNAGQFRQLMELAGTALKAGIKLAILSARPFENHDDISGLKQMMFENIPSQLMKEFEGVEFTVYESQGKRASLVRIEEGGPVMSTIESDELRLPYSIDIKEMKELVMDSLTTYVEHRQTLSIRNTDSLINAKFYQEDKEKAEFTVNILKEELYKMRIYHDIELNWIHKKDGWVHIFMNNSDKGRAFRRLMEHYKLSGNEVLYACDAIERNDKWVLGEYNIPDENIIYTNTGKDDDGIRLIYRMINDINYRISLLHYEEEDHLRSFIMEAIEEYPEQIKKRIETFIESSDIQVWSHEGLPLEVFPDKIVVRGTVDNIKKEISKYPAIMDNFLRNLVIFTRSEDLQVNVNEVSAKALKGDYESIKLYVFDYDGTLAPYEWPEGQPLDSSRFMKLMDLAEKTSEDGGELLVMSSRPARTVEGLRGSRDLITAGISPEMLEKYSGTTIIISEYDGSSSYSMRVEKDGGKLEELEGLPVNVFSKDQNEGIKRLFENVLKRKDITPIHIEEKREGSQIEVRFKYLEEDQVYRIMDTISVELPKIGIRQTLRMAWTDKENNIVTFFVNSADKGMALKDLYEYLDIEPSKVLYTGDGYTTNDRWILADTGIIDDNIVKTYQSNKFEPDLGPDAVFGLIGNINEYHENRKKMILEFIEAIEKATGIPGYILPAVSRKDLTDALLKSKDTINISDIEDFHDAEDIFMKYTGRGLIDREVPEPAAFYKQFVAALLSSQIMLIVVSALVSFIFQGDLELSTSTLFHVILPVSVILAGSVLPRTISRRLFNGVEYEILKRPFIKPKIHFNLKFNVMDTRNIYATMKLLAQNELPAMLKEAADKGHKSVYALTAVESLANQYKKFFNTHLDVIAGIATMPYRTRDTKGNPKSGKISLRYSEKRSSALYDFLIRWRTKRAYKKEAIELLKTHQMKIQAVDIISISSRGESIPKTSQKKEKQDAGKSRFLRAMLNKIKSFISDDKDETVQKYLGFIDADRYDELQEQLKQVEQDTWQKAAASTQKYTRYIKTVSGKIVPVEARFIVDDENLPDGALSYHFFHENDLVIVTGSGFLDEVRYYEYTVSKWLNKGHNPYDARFLATVEEGVEFSKKGELTPLYKKQLGNMNKEYIEEYIVLLSENSKALLEFTRENLDMEYFRKLKRYYLQLYIDARKRFNDIEYEEEISRIKQKGLFYMLKYMIDHFFIRLPREFNDENRKYTELTVEAFRPDLDNDIRAELVNRIAARTRAFSISVYLSSYDEFLKPLLKHVSVAVPLYGLFYAAFNAVHGLPYNIFYMAAGLILVLAAVSSVDMYRLMKTYIGHTKLFPAGVLIGPVRRMFVPVFNNISEESLPLSICHENIHVLKILGYIKEDRRIPIAAAWDHVVKRGYVNESHMPSNLNVDFALSALGRLTDNNGVIDKIDLKHLKSAEEFYSTPLDESLPLYERPEPQWTYQLGEFYGELALDIGRTLIYQGKIKSYRMAVISATRWLSLLAIGVEEPIDVDVLINGNLYKKYFAEKIRASDLKQGSVSGQNEGSTEISKEEYRNSVIIRIDRITRNILYYIFYLASIALAVYTPAALIKSSIIPGKEIAPYVILAAIVLQIITVPFHIYMRARSPKKRMGTFDYLRYRIESTYGVRANRKEMEELLLSGSFKRDNKEYRLEKLIDNDMAKMVERFFGKNYVLLTKEMFKERYVMKNSAFGYDPNTGKLVLRIEQLLKPETRSGLLLKIYKSTMMFNMLLHEAIHRSRLQIPLIKIKENNPVSLIMSKNMFNAIIMGVDEYPTSLISFYYSLFFPVFESVFAIKYFLIFVRKHIALNKLKRVSDALRKEIRKFETMYNKNINDLKDPASEMIPRYLTYLKTVRVHTLKETLFKYEHFKEISKEITDIRDIEEQFTEMLESLESDLKEAKEFNRQLENTLVSGLPDMLAPAALKVISPFSIKDERVLKELNRKAALWIDTVKDIEPQEHTVDVRMINGEIEEVSQSVVYVENFLSSDGGLPDNIYSFAYRDETKGDILYIFSRYPKNHHLSNEILDHEVEEDFRKQYFEKMFEESDIESIDFPMKEEMGKLTDAERNTVLGRISHILASASMIAKRAKYKRVDDTLWLAKLNPIHHEMLINMNSEQLKAVLDEYNKGRHSHISVVRQLLGPEMLSYYEEYQDFIAAKIYRDDRGKYRYAGIKEHKYESITSGKKVMDLMGFEKDVLNMAKDAADMIDRKTLREGYVEIEKNTQINIGLDILKKILPADEWFANFSDFKARDVICAAEDANIERVITAGKDGSDIDISLINSKTDIFDDNKKQTGIVLAWEINKVSDEETDAGYGTVTFSANGDKTLIGLQGAFLPGKIPMSEARYMAKRTLDNIAGIAKKYSDSKSLFSVLDQNTVQRFIKKKLFDKLEEAFTRKKYKKYSDDIPAILADAPNSAYEGALALIEFSNFINNKDDLKEVGTRFLELFEKSDMPLEVLNTVSVLKRIMRDKKDLEEITGLLGELYEEAHRYDRKSFADVFLYVLNANVHTFLHDERYKKESIVTILKSFKTLLAKEKTKDDDYDAFNGFVSERANIGLLQYEGLLDTIINTSGMHTEELFEVIAKGKLYGFTQEEINKFQSALNMLSSYSDSDKHIIAYLERLFENTENKPVKPLLELIRYSQANGNLIDFGSIDTQDFKLLLPEFIEDEGLKIKMGEFVKNTDDMIEAFEEADTAHEDFTAIAFFAFLIIVTTHIGHVYYSDFEKIYNALRNNKKEELDETTKRFLPIVRDFYNEYILKKQHSMDQDIQRIPDEKWKEIEVSLANLGIVGDNSLYIRYMLEVKGRNIKSQRDLDYFIEKVIESKNHAYLSEKIAEILGIEIGKSSSYTREMFRNIQRWFLIFGFGKADALHKDIEKIISERNTQSKEWPRISIQVEDWGEEPDDITAKTMQDGSKNRSAETTIETKKAAPEWFVPHYDKGFVLWKLDVSRELMARCVDLVSKASDSIEFIDSVEEKKIEGFKHVAFYSKDKTKKAISQKYYDLAKSEYQLDESRITGDMSADRIVFSRIDGGKGEPVLFISLEFLEDIISIYKSKDQDSEELIKEKLIDTVMELNKNEPEKRGSRILLDILKKYAVNLNALKILTPNEVADAWNILTYEYGSAEWLILNNASSSMAEGLVKDHVFPYMLRSFGKDKALKFWNILIGYMLKHPDKAKKLANLIKNAPDLASNEDEFREIIEYLLGFIDRHWDDWMTLEGMQYLMHFAKDSKDINELFNIIDPFTSLYINSGLDEMMRFLEITGGFVENKVQLKRIIDELASILQMKELIIGDLLNAVNSYYASSEHLLELFTALKILKITLGMEAYITDFITHFGKEWKENKKNPMKIVTDYLQRIKSVNISADRADEDERVLLYYIDDSKMLTHAYEEFVNKKKTIADMFENLKKQIANGRRVDKRPLSLYLFLSYLMQVSVAIGNLKFTEFEKILMSLKNSSVKLPRKLKQHKKLIEDFIASHGMDKVSLPRERIIELLGEHKIEGDNALYIIYILQANMQYIKTFGNLYYFMHQVAGVRGLNYQEPVFVDKLAVLLGLIEENEYDANVYNDGLTVEDKYTARRIKQILRSRVKQQKNLPVFKLGPVTMGQDYPVDPDGKTPVLKWFIPHSDKGFAAWKLGVSEEEFNRFINELEEAAGSVGLDSQIFINKKLSGFEWIVYFSNPCNALAFNSIFQEERISEDEEEYLIQVNRDYTLDMEEIIEHGKDAAFYGYSFHTDEPVLALNMEFLKNIHTAYVLAQDEEKRKVLKDSLKKALKDYERRSGIQLGEEAYDHVLKLQANYTDLDGSLDYEDIAGDMKLIKDKYGAVQWYWIKEKLKDELGTFINQQPFLYMKRSYGTQDALKYWKILLEYLPDAKNMVRSFTRMMGKLDDLISNEAEYERAAAIFIENKKRIEQGSVSKISAYNLFAFDGVYQYLPLIKDLDGLHQVSEILVDYDLVLGSKEVGRFFSVSMFNDQSELIDFYSRITAVLKKQERNRHKTVSAIISRRQVNEDQEKQYRRMLRIIKALEIISNAPDSAIHIEGFMGSLNKTVPGSQDKRYIIGDPVFKAFTYLKESGVLDNNIIENIDDKKEFNLLLIAYIEDASIRYGIYEEFRTGKSLDDIYNRINSDNFDMEFFVYCMYLKFLSTVTVAIGNVDMKGFMNMVNILRDDSSLEFPEGYPPELELAFNFIKKEKPRYAELIAGKIINTDTTVRDKRIRKLPDDIKDRITAHLAEHGIDGDKALYIIYIIEQNLGFIRTYEHLYKFVDAVDGSNRYDYLQGLANILELKKQQPGDYIIEEQEKHIDWRVFLIRQKHSRIVNTGSDGIWKVGIRNRVEIDAVEEVIKTAVTRVFPSPKTIREFLPQNLDDFISKIKTGYSKIREPKDIIRITGLKGSYKAVAEVIAEVLGIKRDVSASLKTWYLPGFDKEFARYKLGLSKEIFNEFMSNLARALKDIEHEPRTKGVERIERFNNIAVYTASGSGSAFLRDITDLWLEGNEDYYALFTKNYGLKMEPYLKQAPSKLVYGRNRMNNRTVIAFNIDYLKELLEKHWLTDKIRVQILKALKELEVEIQANLGKAEFREFAKGAPQHVLDIWEEVNKKWGYDLWFYMRKGLSVPQYERLLKEISLEDLTKAFGKDKLLDMWGMMAVNIRQSGGSGVAFFRALISFGYLIKNDNDLNTVIGSMRLLKSPGLNEDYALSQLEYFKSIIYTSKNLDELIKALAQFTSKARPFKYSLKSVSRYVKGIKSLESVLDGMEVMHASAKESRAEQFSGKFYDILDEETDKFLKEKQSADTAGELPMSSLLGLGNIF
ncbi:hypothetical protein ACFLTD_00520, partial [Elusimicrobiota bacterium]